MLIRHDCGDTYHFSSIRHAKPDSNEAISVMGKIFIVGKKYFVILDAVAHRKASSNNILFVLSNVLKKKCDKILCNDLKHISEFNFIEP